MNDLSNTPTNTPMLTDGEVTGFETKRIEGAFEITTQFNLDGEEQNSTKVKIFSGVQLTGLSSEFQSAWAQVYSNLGADFSGELFFEDDGDTITILSAGSVVGYATSWQGGSGSWENTRMLGESSVQLEITDTSYGYQVFDDSWSELASSGNSTRTITEVDGVKLTDPITDEITLFTSYHSSKLDYLSDWAALNPSVSEITWDDVASVRVNVNSTTTEVSGNAYREGESQSVQANTEYQFLSVDGLFLGSTEVRDGFTEIRDGNWSLVARKADMAKALTFSDMVADLGANWAAAWSAVEKYLPDDYKPGENGDYTSLKFNYDQWDNILVFDTDGNMVGRLWSWNSSNSHERPWNGDWEIWTHQSFTFNDAQGNNLARFEANDQHASADGKTKGDLNGSGLQVSYGVAKYTYDSEQTITGLNADVDWSEIEALYNLPEGYGDLLFANGWDTDVDFISIGTNTWKNYQYDDDGKAILEDGQPAYNEEKSTRIEYFDIRDVDENGQGGYREFLGVMELRDGFIEIRDQHWNQVARIVDASNAMSFADVAKEYEGFAEAWGLVSAYLPEEMAHSAEDVNGAATALVNDLKFTADDYNIFVFDTTGALLSQVNFWTGGGDHEWTDWNNGNGSELTIQESRYHYNFHDENWQNLAHAGVNKNYITKVDGQAVADPILHEQGTNYGYRVSKEDYIKANGADASKWADLDPSVAQIDWDSVTEIQLNSNSWSSVDNQYREGDPWSDENEQIEYFAKKVNPDNPNNTWTDRVGSTEIRDGFIEIRDEQWNLIARKVDASATKDYDTVVAKYGSAFEAAWGKIGQYLSSDFTPTVTDAQGQPVNDGVEYKNLKFSYGDWNDILVFSPEGEMIGRINTWDNAHVQDRPWNSDFQINSHTNFEFNDADWNQIARYEVNSNQVSSDGVAKDGNVESSGEQISYMVAKSDVDETAWGNLKAAYDLPSSLTSQQVQQLFDTDWDTDVDFISIGTNTWKNYQYDDDGKAILEDGQPAYNEEKSTRIEYFDIRDVDENGQGGYREFLGVMELRDGFIEIRDQHWNQVARIVDASNAMSFADVAKEYEGFAEAWGLVSAYLPEEMAHSAEDVNGAATALVNDLKFTADDYNIFVFDTTGALLSQVNFWTGGGDHEWTDWNNGNGSELTIQESRYHYNFHDENWQNLAHAGVNKNYITKVDGQAVADPILHEQGTNYGYRVSKEDYIKANGADDSKWADLDPSVAQIDWDSVTEIQLNSNSWSSVDNQYREGDPWSDENEQIEYFAKKVNPDNPNNTWTDRVGSTEIRDGFIEIRDEQWNLIARKVDASATKDYDTVVAKYGSAFEAAWGKIGQYLSSDFTPTVTDAQGQPVNDGVEYKNLKFSYGDWNDILVFSPEGEMIGRINTWDNAHVQDRPWNSDYQIQEHISFNFNDADWNQIAQYEVSTSQGSSDGVAKDGNVESTGENISYTVAKKDVSDIAWGNLKALYDLPSSLTTQQAQKLFQTDWDTDVDYISIGTNTWKNYQFEDDGQPTMENGQPAYNEEKSTRIEYFDIRDVDENGQGGYREFLGVMELRDGFIEIRDQHWNQVARIVDASNAMSFADVAKEYEGFAEAWGLVSAYLPEEMAHSAEDVNGAATALVNDLKFTADDYNIFVFDTTGALLSQVNFWTGGGDHEWTDWNNGNGSELTIQESRYHYNFHDENWQNLAHAGVNKNYITKVDGQAVADPILHEQGTNYGYRVSKEDYIKANGADDSKWADLDPSVAQIDWDSVTEIQLNSNSWSSVDNQYREGDPWSDENEQIEYFAKKVNPDNPNNTWTDRVGSTEIRDGFIEIRDEQWNLIARKVDASATKDYDTVVAKYGSAFEAAWGKIGQYLSSDFTPTVTDAQGQPVNDGVEYKNLKFSYGDWNDILVFSPEGEMIGRINTWDNAHVQDRPWNSDFQINSHTNFEFNDADWNQIARYEVNSNQVSSDGVAKDGNVESSGEQISYMVAKSDVDETAWGNLKAAYDLPSSLTSQQVQQLFDTDWDTDVDFISIGTNTWKNYQYDDDGKAILEDGQPAYNEDTSTRIEYFDIRDVDENGQGGYREFLGVMELRDGFIEIRDQHWNQVARIVDASNAMSFADVAKEYEGFAEALNVLDEYLPDYVDLKSFDKETGEATLVNEASLRFTTDEQNIYLFDNTGTLSLIVNTWSQDDTYWQSGREYTEKRINFQFKDGQYNHLAESGSRETSVEVSGSPVLDETSLRVGYTVSKAVADADNNIVMPDFNLMTDPNMAPFKLEDVSSVTVQTNSWQSYAHVYRTENETWSGGAEELQFRDENGNRLGSVETEGSLVKVYNAHRDLVDSYLSSTASGDLLKTVLTTESTELEVLFYEIMKDELTGYDQYKVIESADGPSFLVLNNEIKGLIYYSDWNSEDGRDWYVYEVEDMEGRVQFRAGVGKNSNDSVDPIEPHTVFVSTYAHRDIIAVGDSGQAAWNTILQQTEYAIDDGDFDLADVAVIETRKALIDDSQNDTRDAYPEISYRFVKENSVGKQIWDYFEIINAAGVRTVEKFVGDNWQVISEKITDSTYFLNLQELAEVDKGTADGVLYILQQTQQMSPEIFEKYFDDNFDPNTQFLVNAATMTFIVNDKDGNLIGTGRSFYSFDDHDGSMQFGINFDLVAHNDPVLVSFWAGLDDSDEADFTKEHEISIGQEYTIANYTEQEWQTLVNLHIPTDVDGLDPSQIGIIFENNQVLIDPVNNVAEPRKIVEFIPYELKDGEYEYLWDWDSNYNIKTEYGVESIRRGNETVEQSVELSELTQIVDKSALTTFNAALVETLDFVNVDVFEKFDVYSLGASKHLYLTKKGTTEVVLFMKEASKEWESYGEDPSQVAFDIYSIKSDDYVGWIWQSEPDQPNPMDPSANPAPVTGAVTYGSQFFGIQPDELSVERLAQLKDLGTPVDARYNFDEIDTFGIGARVFQVGGLVQLEAVTIQHEMDGVQDPWIGRMLYETVNDYQISYNYEEDSKALPNEQRAKEVAEVYSLQKDLTNTMLESRANYDPSTQQKTETQLNNISEFHPAAQEILDATEYLNETFSLMSVTDLGDGEARLQLGSGNQFDKIIMKDVTKVIDYEQGDTAAGFHFYDQITENYLGWAWKSKTDDRGSTSSNDPSPEIDAHMFGDAEFDTQISAFELRYVLDALPNAFMGDFKALGVSSVAGNYNISDVDDIHLRRDVYVEVDTNEDVVLDSNGKPKVVSDRHIISHLDKEGHELGGIGIDILSGDTFDFALDDQGKTKVNFDESLSDNEKSQAVASFEKVFMGVVDRLPDMLLSDDQLGGLCDIDPSSEYDQLVGDTHSETVTGLNTFKSAGQELDGFVASAEVNADTDFSTEVTAFEASLSSSWNTKLIDFESSAPGNFAVSGYTASSDDYLADQSGDMSSGANGKLVIEDTVSVTLFNTANGAGDGGNNGDDPGIATNTGNDADRGFNVTQQGDQYLEILAGENLSGGALFCFDELMAPVYGVGFTLMGLEETKRDVYIDVHLSDGNILRETADQHTVNMGGYQFYGYSLDPSYAQSVSIEGFAVYQPFDGESASARDIFAIDDVAVAYGDTSETLCSIDPAKDYDTFLGTSYSTSLPTYMSRFVSDRVELNGEVSSTLSEDPVASGVDLSSYHATVSDFADAVALMSDDIGFVVHDFEASAPGNFAVSGYTASIGDSVKVQYGTMVDPTNGANGTLVTEGVLSVSLFNNGQVVSVDDPGIATHSGNDADRGFNMTISGSKYLEVLPSEQGPGGALFCFDEINVPVYGFGFNLMGTEDPKRDLYIDVHMSDGVIYRETAEAHSLETGGHQYYSFLADPLFSAGASIDGFVLYEDYSSDDQAGDRDIFSVDDIALVVSDKAASLTPEEYVNFSISGPDEFSFTLEIGSTFDLLETDYVASPPSSFNYESTSDKATFTAKLASGNDIVITVDAADGFDPEAKKDISEGEFLEAISLIDNPLTVIDTSIFKSNSNIEDLVISSSYHNKATSVLTITELSDADTGLFDNLLPADLSVTQNSVDDPTKVVSQDNWSVTFSNNFTDSNGNGITDEAIEAVIDIFDPQETLIVTQSV